MINITYFQMLLFITILWLFTRAIVSVKNKKFDLKREVMLLLVYCCIIVVVRFTFCPFGKVNGQIQPLRFDVNKVFPVWYNLKPFVYLFDYESLKEAIINLVGNIAMFIPLGIIWPVCFKKLDTPLKVIGAGFGFSLLIEILQILFFDRNSDIDDLILNTAGFIIGYGIYILCKKIKNKKASSK